MSLVPMNCSKHNITKRGESDSAHSLADSTCSTAETAELSTSLLSADSEGDLTVDVDNTTNTVTPLKDPDNCGIVRNVNPKMNLLRRKNEIEDVRKQQLTKQRSPHDEPRASYSEQGLDSFYESLKARNKQHIEDNPRRSSYSMSTLDSFYEDLKARRNKDGKKEAESRDHMHTYQNNLMSSPRDATGPSITMKEWRQEKSSEKNIDDRPIKVKQSDSVTDTTYTLDSLSSHPTNIHEKSNESSPRSIEKPQKNPPKKNAERSSFGDIVDNILSQTLSQESIEEVVTEPDVKEESTDNSPGNDVVVEEEHEKESVRDKAEKTLEKESSGADEGSDKAPITESFVQGDIVNEAAAQDTDQVVDEKLSDELEVSSTTKESVEDISDGSESGKLVPDTRISLKDDKSASQNQEEERPATPETSESLGIPQNVVIKDSSSEVSEEHEQSQKTSNSFDSFEDAIDQDAKSKGNEDTDQVKKSNEIEPTQGESKSSSIPSADKDLSFESVSDEGKVNEPLTRTTNTTRGMSEILAHTIPSMDEIRLAMRKEDRSWASSELRGTQLGNSNTEENPSDHSSGNSQNSGKSTNEPSVTYEDPPVIELSQYRKRTKKPFSPPLPKSQKETTKFPKKERQTISGSQGRYTAPRSMQHRSSTRSTNMSTPLRQRSTQRPAMTSTPSKPRMPPQPTQSATRGRQQNRPPQRPKITKRSLTPSRDRSRPMAKSSSENFGYQRSTCSSRSRSVSRNPSRSRSQNLISSNHSSSSFRSGSSFRSTISLRSDSSYITSNRPDDPDKCTTKWKSAVHGFKDACDRCLDLASGKEKREFYTKGHHPRIMLTRGGCAMDCKLYDSRDESRPVRLCRKCFDDTHRIKRSQSRSISRSSRPEFR